MGTLEYERSEQMTKPTMRDFSAFLAVSMSAVVIVITLAVWLVWGPGFRVGPALFAIGSVVLPLPLFGPILAAVVTLKPKIWHRAVPWRKRAAWGIWMLGTWPYAVWGCLSLAFDGEGWVCVLWGAQLPIGLIATYAALKVLGPEVRREVGEFLGDRYSE